MEILSEQHAGEYSIGEFNEIIADYNKKVNSQEIDSKTFVLMSKQLKESPSNDLLKLHGNDKPISLQEDFKTIDSGIYLMSGSSNNGYIIPAMLDMQDGYKLILLDKSWSPKGLICPTTLNSERLEQLIEENNAISNDETVGKYSSWFFRSPFFLEATGSKPYFLNVNNAGTIHHDMELLERLTTGNVTQRSMGKNGNSSEIKLIGQYELTNIETPDGFLRYLGFKPV